jgi:hypothetical protein
MAVQTPAQPEPAVAPREATDVGQFMRFVASTIAKLPPEERTFVRFLIAPKATPLVMNDRIDVIFKNIDLLEDPHIEALSKTMSPEGRGGEKKHSEVLHRRSFLGYVPAVEDHPRRGFWAR